MVRIDYFENSRKGYLLNQTRDHILLGNCPNDWYITFDNVYVKLPDYDRDITISTKMYHKSEISIEAIKRFIEKYLLSDGHIPHLIVRVKNSNGEIIDALCTTNQICYISHNDDIYEVDIESDIVESNHDIMYFEPEQDREIAYYVWNNASDFLKPVDDALKSKIYILNSTDPSNVFTTDYFIMIENTNYFDIYFCSQNDDEISYISTDSDDIYCVSWAHELSEYIKNSMKK